MGSQDPDFSTRVTLLKDTLRTANDLYTGYAAMSRAQGASIDTNTGLRSELTNLKAQLASVKKSAETYDREFLDRKQAGEGVTTRWRRWGFSTLQDWTLAAFFASYAFATLTLLLYVYLYAPNTSFAMGVVALASVVLGVFVSVILLRLG